MATEPATSISRRRPTTLPQMLMVRPRLRRSKGSNVLNSSFGAFAHGVDLWKTETLRALHLLPDQKPSAPAPAIQTPRYNDGVSFTIRDFQPADFDTLWHIDQGCFPAGISYSRAELRFYMRRRGSFTLLAVNDADQSVVGFIVAEGDRGSGHVITIDVIGLVRRSGIGSLLLDAAENHLRAAHCHSVELETAVDNISALSFYKRHGYSVIKTFPRYYSNGVDALVLERALEPAR